VPAADASRCSKPRDWKVELLNHLIGAQQDRLRNRKPKRLGSLEIECAAERHGRKEEGNNMK